MSRIKKMSTWASSLIGPDVFPLLFFFVPSNLLFVLFPFIFFLFHVVKGRTFRRGSTDFSFCKILFPLLSFQFFFFFSVVLWFAIEHPFIMYWSWVPPPIPPHHSRCVTAPKRVGFFSLHFYIGWELKIVMRIGNFFFFYYFFFCLWRRDDTLFVSDENNKTYNLNSLFFLIYLCIIFFFPQ